MRHIFTFFLHAIVIIIRLGRPGGLRSVVAESVLMRHQILILNRGRKRAQLKILEAQRREHDKAANAIRRQEVKVQGLSSVASLPAVAQS